jgi:hypothetical protein
MDNMKILLIAFLLAPLVCRAAESPAAGPAASSSTLTNRPADAASDVYAQELREKLAERKRMEARVLVMEAVIPRDDWRLPLKVTVPAPSSPVHNWLDELKEVDAANPAYHELAEKLRTSKVPNEEAAKRAAIAPLVRALGANEILLVSSLLRLAHADQKLGQAGDFVWEVRVEGGGVTGLLWVGATTGEVKVLYRQ